MNNSSIQEEYPTRDSLVAFLRAELKSYVKSEQELSEEQGFMEMGLDSLELLDIALVVEEKIGLQIEADQLFEFSTIASFASFLFELIHSEACVQEPPLDTPELAKPKKEVAIVGI